MARAGFSVASMTDAEQDRNSGSGSSLPVAVLLVAGISTVIAVLVSAMSIYLHLKNYLKPSLQRMVIRIMIMVPLYAVSSLISLFSLEAAFFIDVIRDIYEAFVIYCFFVLLISYLGGERSLLILLHGRPPKDPVFPVSLFKREIDVSDPYTFLFLKRGILQYVQVKPLLAIASLVLKVLGKYNEGDFRAKSGYLYVSVVYNISICLSLYCLAVFWLCVNDDLKPFRPMPKFLCVKGILFFSFWQAIGISLLVAAGAIKRLGPYTDSEHISLGLTDCLICIEMPFFAWAHLYAFSFKDFVDPSRSYVARMPMYYAFRDAFGMRDVVADSKATLRGEGMDYRDFEPSEGYMHQGEGRERRIRAGLRYSKGGKRKYWLPQATKDTQPSERVGRGVNNIIKRVAGADQAGDVHAPLLEEDEEDVVHLAPDMIQQDPNHQEDPSVWTASRQGDGFGLPFGDTDEGDEELFQHSRKYLFGDYNYPCIDVSSEYARGTMWDEEERILRDERGAWFSPIRGDRGTAALKQREGPAWEGYGAVGNHHPKNTLREDAGSGYMSHSSQAKGKRREGERMVDYEQQRTPADDADDVKLRFTNVRKPQSRPHSNSNSQVRNGSYFSGAASSPTSSGSGGSRPLKGKVNIIRTPPVTSPGKSPVLPPDAVDLIVEDHEAAEEERTWERRKGEPAVRGSALRKAYRKGFVVHDGESREAEVEVEVENPEVGYIREDQEPSEDGEDGAAKLDEEDATLEALEGTIAREMPPPLHSQASPYGYSFYEDEDNPWA